MSGTDSPDLAFNYRDLWYIKLIPGGKNPIETWGGYDQDFESAENVYSHEQVLESEHEWWGICGIKDLDHSSRLLLVFDIDVHKAPEEWNRDHLQVMTDDTPLIKSQSGGFHTYSAVRSAAGKESDFSITEDIPFDIDVRGSFVKHHVVAPNDIPGVETDYEVVNDARIRVSEPGDACELVRYVENPDAPEDSVPLLEYDPNKGVDIGSFSHERSGSPPEDMPTCYARGLELRKAAPDDPNYNSHKVNTLTALCGLAAGYPIEDMVDHFCADYPPNGAAVESDRAETEYQINQMAPKELAPPAISTLREYGILDADETCDCDIDYHGGTIGSTALLADGGSAAAVEPVADDSDKEAQDGTGIRRPVYEVLPPEGGNVDLHLIPVDGTTARVEIKQNGQAEYIEELDRGFWNNRTIRGRIASEVAGSLTGVDQGKLKRGIKDALNQVGVDQRERATEFEAVMRSDLEQGLRDRTVDVVCHPTADSAEWVVTMDPPEDSPLMEPRELSLGEGDFNDANAGTFILTDIST